MTEENEYTLRANAMANARRKFAKLERKAEKLGLPAPRLNVLSEIAVPLRWIVPDNGNEPYWTKTTEELAERHEREYVVTVEGEELALPGGWRLAGTLQHTEAGNAVRMVPGTEVDGTPYRTGDAVCDHCRKSRLRRDTYLVVNAEGEVKRVGSNCIRDFLGHGDPTAIVAFARDVLGAVRDLDEEPEGGRYGIVDRSVVHMPDLLAETVAAIDAHGWTPKSAVQFGGTATAEHAIDNLFATCEQEGAWHARNCNRSHRSNARPNEDQRAEADVVLAYVRDKLDAPDYRCSDFEWNLRVALDRTWIEPREVGIAAFAVTYYRQDMEQEVKRAAAAKNPAASSEWQGAVKERLRGLRLQVTLTRVFGDEDDLYGTRTLVKFLDEQGNVFEWWSSNGFDSEIGDWWTVTGTVKKHDEYKGTKATVLSRCAVESTTPPE